eukprot:TRINITY_DN457_c0_g1_i5.p1 TRINITY_DN457_c0_g1~~TRINITY_DN457_c0_g1_i5.p1  ORF type:complete len:903 (+),score=350.39 TRINITY_DN457_c0_g1_i5:119-2827(+)
MALKNYVYFIFVVFFYLNQFNFCFGDDACTFLPFYDLGGGTFWSKGSLNELKNCFDIIPLESNIKTQTITQLQILTKLYSFTDISSNSDYPFFQTVDLDAGLNTISNKVYDSDFMFHDDLNVLFNKLGDAHTLYFAPSPYLKFFRFLPFGIESYFENGEQVFYTVGESTVAGISFSELSGFDVTPYVDFFKINTVNGLPAIEWIKTLANSMGTARDEGNRLNNFLLNGVPFTSIGLSSQSIYSLSDFDVFEFEGVSGTVSIPVSFLITTTYANASSIISQMGTSGPQLRQVYENQYVAGSKQNKSPKELKIKILKEDEILNARLISDLYNKEFEFPTYYEPYKNGLNHYAKIVKKENPNKRKLEKKETVTQITTVFENSLSGVNCYTLSTASGEYALIQITSFAPINFFFVYMDNLSQDLNTCFENSRTQSITKAIIDVRSNGGGFVCASQLAQLAFNPVEWSISTGRNLLLFEPFDFRRSEFTDLYLGTNILPNNEVFSPVDGQSYTDESWYFPGVEYTRGGKTSTYTNKFYFPDCFNFINYTRSDYTYERMVILSDGLCGSACSQFISKLRFHGKAGIANIGGIFTNSEQDTSSFCGGNVEDWTPFVERALAVNPSSGLDYLPTNAFTRFNFREMYLGNTDLPREMTMINADWFINIWPYPGYLNDQSLQFDIFGVLIDILESQESLVSPLGDYFDPTPASLTASASRSLSRTASTSASTSISNSVLVSLSRTPSTSVLVSLSRTPSTSVLVSLSRTPSISRTQSISPTNSETPSRTPTGNASPTRTRTVSPTRNPSQTGTASFTASNSRSRSLTRTASTSVSSGYSPSVSPSVTRSSSNTRSTSVTRSLSSSTSISATQTLSNSRTPSRTPTISRSSSISISISITPTKTRSPSKSPVA